MAENKALRFSLGDPDDDGDGLLDVSAVATDPQDSDGDGYGDYSVRKKWPMGYPVRLMAMGGDHFQAVIPSCEDGTTIAYYLLLNWIIMAKYSKKAQEKIAGVMKEFKEGKLHSSSGDKVTERDQAIAIGISEAEQAGLKVPKQKKESSAKTKKKKSSWLHL